MTLKKINFIDNPGAKSGFVTVYIDSASVLKSWKKSLYSYEWLDSNGDIKPVSKLKPAEYDKRKSVEACIQNEQPLSTPILGIGIMDNIEIGSARAELLTCIDLGYTTLPAHIPQSQQKDFKPFLAKADQTNKKAEAGSVLFYILIAVALLAALSFTIAKSTQSEVSGMSDEQAGLIASEIITATGFMAETISKLRLNGCAENQISFEAPNLPGYNNGSAPNDNSCHIFHINGGSLNHIALDKKAGTNASWFFTGMIKVDQIGTSCSQSECVELLAIAQDISKTVCERANKSLGIAGTPNNVTSVETLPPFQGVFGHVETIDHADLAGKAAGCFVDNGKYYFYRVLLRR